MKLFAISDLHVGYAKNRDAVAELGVAEGATPDDWLIVAGDVGETETHLAWTFERLSKRFAKLFWVPGNHELWSTPDERVPGRVLRGPAKYDRLVETCRAHGVLTPEDPYVSMPGTNVLVAPLFALYDYSFRPADVPEVDAVKWATESGPMCADEARLEPAPHASFAAWCAVLCDRAEARLERALAEAAPGTRTVLVNHFPLRHEHSYMPLLPTFSIWCGTKRTTDWHRRFAALAVVTGHLHMRTSRVVDGVRFEEVSLGYPAQWARRGGPPRMKVILSTDP